MNQAARVNFNVKNFTAGISAPLSGVFYVLGVTERGPIMRPDLPESLINSWAKYQRVFGGMGIDSDFPILCRRALDQGATLRICRVDTEAPSSVKATAMSIGNAEVSPEPLFTIQPKYEGAYYNKFKVAIQETVGGLVGNFDILITCEDNPDLNESYTNIPPFLKDVASKQSNLDNAIAQSSNFDFSYLDLSDIAGDLFPDVQEATAFTGGVDPDDLLPADYINALNTFDELDDGMILAIPEEDDDAVNAGAALYAKNRGDIVFFAHLPTNLVTADTIITERDAIASNTKHIGIFGGGIKFRHPDNPGQIVSTSEIGDVLGIAAKVHANQGPWFSLSGYSRGQVRDAIGVINNFGSPAKFNELNQLAKAQVNMMVVKNNLVQLSGNFSGQKENNLERFLSIVFLVIWMKRTIKPVLEEYLEEPCDPITFKSIYNRIRPLLDDLTSPSKRALYRYEYYGDQDATTLEDLQVNDPVAVGNGKYKIKLKIWPIPSLQELTFDLMLVVGEGVTID